MKVLIVATGYPRWKGDFANVYLHRLAKSLVNKGVEVHVVAPHANGLKKNEIMDDVYIHRFQYLYPEKIQSLAYFPGMPEKVKTIRGKMQLPFFMLSMIKKMISVVKKYDIDVINAHWAIPPGFVATVTKKIHKKPVLIRVYGAELFPVLKGSSMFFKIAKLMIKYALNSAEKVVSNSDVSCNAGKEISGREDIEILPDGVDTETFNPNVNGDEIRKKYGRFIFSSGRMVERKGFIYLVEAVPYILKEFPKMKLIIGGDGPERKNLENEVNKLKIENNVIFPGFISDEDFPKYMKSADVFVLPSIVDSKGDTEGLGLVLAEAMACGVPVIGTKVGGIPYIIKNSGGGFLVEQKNPKELAEKIIMLLKDEKLRKEMGKIGRKYAKEKFGWGEIAERYYDIFEKVTKG